jgi:hypothetical protein
MKVRVRVLHNSSFVGLGRVRTQPRADRSYALREAKGYASAGGP